MAGRSDEHRFVSVSAGRRLLVAAVVTACCAALVGCSGDSSANEALDALVAPTGAPVVLATATPAPTATPTHTATAVPTATPTPTPNLTPEALQGVDLDKIREVHMRFMTEMLTRDERTPEDVERFRVLVEELTTGEQTTITLNRLQERQSRQEYIVSPGYESRILNIDVHSATLAQVYDCSLDRSVTYDESGEMIIGIGTVEQVRSTVQMLVDGTWRVAQFQAGGAPDCATWEAELP